MTARAGRSLMAVATLAFLVSALAVLLSPLDLLLFLVLLTLFTAPGWPLARWFAGDDADPVTRTTLALLLGYLAGATVYVVLRLAGVSSPFGVLLACPALALVLLWLLRGPRDGVVALARLEPGDLAGLAVLWLIVTAIVGPVFARVGQSTSGGLAYRAYFIADLFAHMTVVAELVKGATPPLNPFYPHESFPYYWTYFTLPALFAKLRPELIVDRGILATDIFAAGLLVSTGYIVLRSVGASALAATISWIVVIVASSFEGLYFLWTQLTLKRPLDGFRYVNIDAITRWFWDLPPVDGLHRIMWYTPQHEMAISFGLIVLLTTVLARRPNSLSRGVVDGLFLGAVVAFSSFNGVLLVAWYAITEVTILALDRGRDLGQWVLSRGVAALIVLCFLGLTLALGMVQHTPNAFILGWNRHFLRGPLAFVFLSFGPALLFAPLGLARLRQSSRLLIALAALTLVCLVLFLFVDLRGHENTYVTFRTGQLMFLVLAILLAFAIDTWRRWSTPVAQGLFAALLITSVLAVPTVAMDWYNARDIDNTAMDPGGFPWTLYVTPDDQAAARWIRENLPIDAQVQTDPWSRARNEWAFVTVFAERRMTTGIGIFELNPARFQQNVNRIKIVFRTLNVDESYGYCQRMNIEYLYVGDIERRIHGAGVLKFGAHPEKFQLVYRSGSVEIYKVLGAASAARAAEPGQFAQ
jgi:hypothetical protein